MDKISLSRRRFISIVAGTAASLQGQARAKPQTRWQGTLMGAAAQIDIQGVDEAQAQAFIRRSFAEARRLERIFSLYRDDSALSQCNRDGFLLAPPAEFAALLRRCQELHRLTGGRFDPTIQPLWAFYAAHFARDPEIAPDAKILQSIRTRVGIEKLKVTDDRVLFTRSGMALTFNGIAQGFITDRIATLLTDAGFDHCLVDLGEIRATGPKLAGEPWMVGMRSADGGEGIVSQWPLRSGAIATSSANGFMFSADGLFNHIFDPVSARCARPGRSISVTAPDATAADGLSTAFALMEDDDIQACLQGLSDINVLVVEGNEPPRLLQRG